MSSGGGGDCATASAAIRRGVLCGLTAYLVWGFFPLFFKMLSHVPPLEVVAHRIVWSMLFLAVLVTATGRWGEIGSALRVAKTFSTLCATTVLIAVNWLVFIYAVGHGEVLQSSLGYFINPLVNVFLGYVLLGERLQRWQTVSLVLAMTGVVLPAVRYGQVPWIALVLAVSFGLYGLLRKTVAVDSLVGLSIETFLAGPVALLFLVKLGFAGQGAFLAGSLHDNLILPLTGLVTAVPLLLFTAAARRLRLVTMGFLQYITPSLHFLLAVWVYGERFTATHLFSFLCIWSGLALYSWSAFTMARRVAAPAVVAEVERNNG
jgi:chloramphenicol-sensitive protein RarD